MLWSALNGLKQICRTSVENISGGGCAGRGGFADDDDGLSDFSSNDSAFFRFNSAFQDGVKHALEFLSESN